MRAWRRVGDVLGGSVWGGATSVITNNISIGPLLRRIDRRSTDGKQTPQRGAGCRIGPASSAGIQQAKTSCPTRRCLLRGADKGPRGGRRIRGPGGCRGVGPGVLREPGGGRGLAR